MNKKNILVLLIITFTIVIILLNYSQIIIINRFEFQPEEINIEKGTRIYWINIDLEEHNVTSNTMHDVAAKDQIIQIDISDDIGTLGLFSYKFTETGEFYYYCTIHPHMKGKIYVIN